MFFRCVKTPCWKKITNSMFLRQLCCSLFLPCVIVSLQLVLYIFLLDFRLQLFWKIHMASFAWDTLIQSSASSGPSQLLSIFLFEQWLLFCSNWTSLLFSHTCRPRINPITLLDPANEFYLRQYCSHQTVTITTVCFCCNFCTYSHAAKGIGENDYEYEWIWL